MSCVARYQPWSQEDLTYLATHWPRGGWRAVRDYFTERGRTYGGVVGKVETLKLRVAGRKKPVRRVMTPAIKAQIEAEYRNGQPNLMKLSRQTGCHVGWLKWHAQCLGLARLCEKSQRFWTEEEQALLEDCLEKGLSLATMGRRFRKAGFTRSLSALQNRVMKNGLCFDRDFFTGNDVVRMLRVDHHRVTAWIAAGQLRAVKGHGPSVDPDESGGKGLWQIKRGWLRHFLIHHPGLWDHRRVNKEVLLELLCGGAVGVGRFSEGDE
jgi:hypothetical protein